MSYKQLSAKATFLSFVLALILVCQSFAESPDIPEGKEKDYDYLIGATRIGNVDPYFDYLLGRLYVEMDSLDAALRHYEALKMRDIDYATNLRFMMLRNPLGPAKLYPDFKYPAALEKIIPSLIDVSASDEDVLKGYGFVGWGCVLDQKGLYYTYLNNYEKARFVRMRIWLMEPINEEHRKWDMGFWGYYVVESKSKFINDEYLIVETEYNEGLTGPEIREDDLLPGEPVMLIQNPFRVNNIICTGQAVMVRNEPMLGKSIEIEPVEHLEKDMILVADTLGRLVGFASVSADPEDNNIYAFPVHCSSRFLGNTEYSVKGLADVLDERASYEKGNTKLLSNFELGKSLVWQGKYEEAIKVFDGIISGHPDEARPYLYRGFAQWKIGNTDAAIADFTIASEKDDELDEAQYQLALLYESINDMDKAEDALKKACGMGKRNPLPHFHLAKYYKDCGKKRKFKMEYATLKNMDKDLAEQIEN